MKRRELATLALSSSVLLGAGPAPLLVGVVHDQFGQPVAGARVQSGTQQATTDAAGTFALPAGGANETVLVTCAYCTTVRLRSTPDQPLIVIVRRFEQVAQSAPTDRDLAALPYTSLASTISLRPYAVLDDSAAPIPGPRVTLFGGSTVWGGLTLDDGIPNYDVAASVPTFSFFPAFSVQHLDVVGPDQAFRYGDNAGSGTFYANTRAQPGTSAVLAAGGEQAVHVAQSSPDTASAFSLSSSPIDSRYRADAAATVPIGDDTIDATVVHAGSHQASDPDSLLTSAFDAVKLTYRRVRDDTVQADAILDQGGYDGTIYDGPINADWSDFSVDAGVQTPGALHAFADAVFRKSTGYYSDPTLVSPIAGSIAQAHADAGAQIAGANYAASAGVGAYAIGYTGGTGTARPYSERIVLPSVSFTYAPNDPWSATITSGAWFRLPSLLQTYGFSPGTPTLPIDKSADTIAQIDYGDKRRIRLEVLDVSGGVQASGADLAWAIAPSISVRAWTLHFNNTREGVANTVNSIWTTYDNPGGVRIDLVERRDLLDDAPHQHLDASLSTPLSAHLRWFAATEVRALTRFYETGIQLAP